MNAKDELVKCLKDNKVKCISIKYEKSYDKDEIFTLKEGYTEKDYEEFLEQLDFNYDNGYGGQELFGIVWCEDSVWLSRGEYDGSEWWQVNKYPEIPNELKSRKKN